MADKDEVQIKITLDTNEAVKGFAKIEKEAGKTAQRTEDKFIDAVEGMSSGISGLVTRFGPVAIAGLGAAKLLQEGFVKALDFALLGEKTKAVETQFNALANSAGVAANSLKDGVVAATQGLIDDEDALQLATKSLVALGNEAARLPQIMNLARNASRGLGTDFKETFGNISSFIENGNIRVLRQYGIVLDLQKAYEDAAKSIGVATNQLTEQQQQSVRLDLILNQVGQKFSSTAESVTPLKDAIDRLKVSLGNTTENAAVGFDNILGPSLTRITNRVRDLVEGKNTLRDMALLLSSGPGGFLADAAKKADDFSNVSLQEIKAQSQKTTAEIISLNKQLEVLLQERLGAKGVSELTKYSTEITLLRRRIADLGEESKKSLVELSARSDNDLFAALDASRSKGSTNIKATNEQLAEIFKKRKEQEAELTRFVLAQNKTRSDVEANSPVDAKTALEKRDVILAQFASKTESVELQHQERLKQIQTQFSAEKGFNQAQRDAAELSSDQLLQAQKVDLKKREAQQLKEIQAQITFDQLDSYAQIGAGFNAFTEGFKLSVEEFRVVAVKSFQEVGRQAFNSLGRGVGAAFAAFGQALYTGEDAAKAFLNSLLGIFADIAIQLGTSFILQGIAHSLNPLTPGIGGPLIAAGAALAAFGGLLKGVAGAKPQTSTGASDTGGGLAAQPSSQTDLVQPNELQRQEPGTTVQVTIQGDILDSDETGSRVIALINKEFNKNGTTVLQGAFT